MRSPAPRATTEQGRVRGEWDGATAVFRGIPFAQPPVGDLRWRAPRPPAAWDGEREALRFGAAPLQPSPPTDSVMYRTNFDDGHAIVMSEDCLTLNVWTPEPRPGAGLAVLVWVHGGGNRYGYGSQRIQDAARLAARGIVVVTLNHRLGALGFLAHEELAAEDPDGASGNYGLLDVVAALEWVQSNVDRFGGDPARVTLGGNSAGAAHVTHLMASRRSADLFAAAVVQSSSGAFRAEGAMPSPEAARAAGAAFAEAFGGAGIDRLRRVSAVELALVGHFGPVLDGRLLTVDTTTVFERGEQAAVPLLAGANDDEGSPYATREDAAALRARIARHPGLAAVYPVADAEQAARSARAYVGESRFDHPVWHTARTHSDATSAPVWQYRFRRPPPVPADVAAPRDGVGGYGAYHTAELPYVWDNLAKLPWRWNDDDRRLAALMADAWVRFVERHDPRTVALASWPAAGADDRAMHLGHGAPSPGAADPRGALRVLAGLPRPI